MIRNQTARNGQRTRKISTRVSPFAIEGKDPNFEYSFRRYKDIEEGGGQDQFGYEAVDIRKTGETWAGPKELRRGMGGQVKVADVIFCRRPNSVRNYFKAQDDERYNAQVCLVRDAAKASQMKLRMVDPDGIVELRSSGLDKAFTQRSGISEDAPPVATPKPTVKKRGRPRKKPASHTKE